MEALYHVSDGDNKRTIRDMVRSVVQFNSDGLDHSHGHRGRGWQCLLFLVYLDPIFSRCLNTKEKAAKEEDEHREVNSTFTLCSLQKYHL